MRRIPIGLQLGSIIAMTILLLTILLGVSLYEFKEISEAYQYMLSGPIQRTTAMLKAQDDFHLGQSDMRAYVGYGEERYARSTIKYLEASHEVVKKYIATVTTVEGRQTGEKLQIAMDEYISDLKRAIVLKQANDPSYATVLSAGRQKTDMVNELFDKAQVYQDAALKQLVQQANEKQSKVFMAILGVSAVGTLCIIILAVWYSRKLSSRMKHLREILLTISALDLSQKDVHATRNDEMGDMAEAAIKMKLALRDIVGQIRHNADSVAASSEELTSSVDQQLQVSENIAKTVTEVAAGAVQNTTNITEISAVIQEVNAGAEEMSASASQVNQVTREAVNHADQGMQLIEKVVVQNETIEHSMAEITKVSDSLVKGSANIQEIIGVISSIAGQTNLLALNAAIEAARAGEAGRGFAVVAEEVRKLAEQSADATNHIGEIINRMTTDIRFTVDVVSKTNSEVVAGKAAADETQKGFSAIIRKLDETRDGIEKIALAVDETAKGMQSIVNNVQNISAVAEETGASSETVAASAEEQTASLNEVHSNAEALAKMAIELNEITARFRV